jgi:hypothetical protein
MVRIELDDFSLDVPLKQRMTVSEFLAVAERLERLTSHKEVPSPMPSMPSLPPFMATTAPAASVTSAPATTDHFRLDPMHEVEFLQRELHLQSEIIKHHDDLINQMIEYLQSLDEHFKH